MTELMMLDTPPIDDHEYSSRSPRSRLLRYWMMRGEPLAVMMIGYADLDVTTAGYLLAIRGMLIREEMSR